MLHSSLAVTSLALHYRLVCLKALTFDGCFWRDTLLKLAPREGLLFLPSVLLHFLIYVFSCLFLSGELRAHFSPKGLIILPCTPRLLHRRWLIVGHPICLESLSFQEAWRQPLFRYSLHYSLGHGNAGEGTCLESCGKLKPWLTTLVFMLLLQLSLSLSLTHTHAHTCAHTGTSGDVTRLLTSVPLHNKKLQRQIKCSVWIWGWPLPVLGRSHRESLAIMCVKHAREVLSTQ